MDNVSSILSIPLDLLLVPYKGSGPSLTDVMGGHVQYTFDSPSTTFDLIQSGKLKAIGVAGPSHDRSETYAACMQAYRWLSRRYRKTLDALAK